MNPTKQLAAIQEIPKAEISIDHFIYSYCINIILVRDGHNRTGFSMDDQVLEKFTEKAPTALNWNIHVFYGRQAPRRSSFNFWFKGCRK